MLITHVAGRNPDKTCVFALPRPKRHHHLFQEMYMGGMWEQGFWCDKEKVFLTREEAYKVAVENGQFNRRVSPFGYNGDKLFSEDLW